MKKWGKRLFILFIVFFAFAGLRSFFKESPAFGKALGVLELEGTFWLSDEWVKDIEEFRKAPNIAGVVVRINSPGGTVAAAQEIYESLKRLGKTKPVVASMGTIAASGGLYIAMGADTIVADPGTLTGSIGVITKRVNLEELLQFAKIRMETLKSGRLKDLGNISRAWTPEEKGLLEEMLVEIHEQFKNTVAEARKLDRGVVDTFADGRIFTGAKAKELGLVDEIGDMGRAVEIAAKKAKIEGEPRLIYSEESKGKFFKSVFGSVKAYLRGPMVCYLYP